MKKYKVTLANNEILHLTRSWADYWIYDRGKTMSFKNPDGKKIRLSVHWVIKIEEE